MMSWPSRAGVNMRQMLRNNRVTRRFMKARAGYKPHQGTREAARRLRQLQDQRLFSGTASLINGLWCTHPPGMAPNAG